MTSSELSELARRLAPLVAPLIAREVVATLFPTIRASIPTATPPAAPTPPAATVLPMFDLATFAAVVGRHPEVVRRRIRSRRIPRDLVQGPPYRLHPKALTLFAVTHDIAAARLAELRAEQQAKP